MLTINEIKDMVSCIDQFTSALKEDTCVAKVSIFFESIPMQFLFSPKYGNMKNVKFSL